ncbi:hypothetical protein O3M35_006080 [Rhynocoris fuscipes]|uniref:Uncharacterized protein n=1 Tax=Rhynocoris fuscipes TaxID=488301 RepID=A0AAW1DC65_9HEMI
MKNVDLKISTEISVLILHEPILTIFGKGVCVCVCVYADVCILHNSKTIGHIILKFWI